MSSWGRTSQQFSVAYTQHFACSAFITHTAQLVLQTCEPTSSRQQTCQQVLTFSRTYLTAVTFSTQGSLLGGLLFHSKTCFSCPKTFMNSYSTGKLFTFFRGIASCGASGRATQHAVFLLEKLHESIVKQQTIVTLLVVVQVGGRPRWLRGTGSSACSSRSSSGLSSRRTSRSAGQPGVATIPFLLSCNLQYIWQVTHSV